MIEETAVVRTPEEIAKQAADEERWDRQHRRQIALTQAVTLHAGKGPSPDLVMDTAKMFYDFLSN